MAHRSSPRRGPGSPLHRAWAGGVRAVLFWSAALLVVAGVALLAVQAPGLAASAAAGRGQPPARRLAATATDPPAVLAARADPQLGRTQPVQRPATAADIPPEGQDGSYLAMCIAVKDEHCDIREWVLHHATLGAGKFYIFDTGSEPPMQPVLDDLIATGLVEYAYVTNTTQELHLERPKNGRSYNWQRPIYSLCLQRYGSRHRWMGFIDADEFVLLQEGVESLPALLRGYESHGGLGLHWQFFAFDGHVERPAGGVLASYTACCGRDAHGGHRHVKSFVQPRRTVGPQTVHSFNYKPGFGAVNTAGTVLHGPLLKPGQQVSYTSAVLHHYISRSLADFEVKQARRDGTGSVKTLSSFFDWKRKCTARCEGAVAVGTALGARYDLNRNVPPRCLEMERRRR